MGIGFNVRRKSETLPRAALWFGDRTPHLAGVALLVLLVTFAYAPARADTITESIWTTNSGHLQGITSAAGGTNFNVSAAALES